MESNLEKVLSQKSILVTGGTGSFGNFVVPELLKFDVKEVVVLSRDEEKQLEMRRKYDDKRLRFVIADVRDIDSLYETIDQEYVLHAAALKIISTCEQFPSENYKTNVLGTLNVKRACMKSGVEKAIFIGTDKAVKPINAYGMAKALATKIWLEHTISKCKFATVRYGNVVGSRGSVIPYFKQLIEEQKPLPITHNSMTRFLITLKEAVKLVLNALRTMKGGEIFVPNIPACNILDLVSAMGGANYPVQTIGVRIGEKIHEVLISEEEMRRTELTRDDYFIIRSLKNYRCKFEDKEFSSDKAKRLTVPEIKQLLGEAGF